MTHSLVLDDVTKSFGRTSVLEGITLTIDPGETVAVMGPSGSGKSTLLHCMSGMLTPTAGSVSFGDLQISALDDRARSRLRLEEFGFVFQDSQLLPELTAVDNVALPAILTGMPRGKARDIAQNLLAQLGIDVLAYKRPGQVSGGQAQRIAIARALAGSPSIVFADEPTGALDQTTGQEVMQLLTAVAANNGTTLVVVTHDVAVASWLDRRVEIRDGIIHNDQMMRGVR
ncbi:macrolide ABC transporter ATP-binding protein [Corynebacterium yudongzhengii]|uniref:ABC transporter ATP-binding protein n=1 Tax=Corynebacterium yudongzhengii TaxID=2080740 RepID=A0A2U1T7N9_9CORY|nr:ABC transporter ATP-binding protein [Corynebacterium yudongzhengii]AWB81521.1 macrolide ABC transporter ATP-binding protein [Corynebacterium yudongzhengii]PWC01908.1 ABC transporter ATP-binding protein [Corynebacterium yudongzhengii]